MIDRSDTISDIAHDTLNDREDPYAAVSELAHNPSLTPHGVVEAARAVSEISYTPVSDVTLHALATKAAVNTIRARNGNSTVAYQRRQINSMRKRAADHIAAVRSARATEHHADQDEE